MNASLDAFRTALRRCRHSLSSALAIPRSATSAYHSYSLPTSLPHTNSIPQTTIAQPDPLPLPQKTRRNLKRDPLAPAQAAKPTIEAEGQAVATTAPEPKASRPRPQLRPRKAAIRLTPAAVDQLRTLLDQPEPKIIKVGVRNRGCSGLAYHLQYVDKPGTFDETVEQDGVKVLIDSKALFSIIGSEMDWIEDKLSQRFTFKNPNIKEQCGCGESFMV